MLHLGRMIFYYIEDAITGLNIKTAYRPDQIRGLARLSGHNAGRAIAARGSVKIVYYDQEGVFRTDSVDSIHPDYNHQFEYIIKPKDGAKFFTREELSKCPGLFYFTLY